MANKQYFIEEVIDCKYNRETGGDNSVSRFYIYYLGPQLWFFGWRQNKVYINEPNNLMGGFTPVYFKTYSAAKRFIKCFLIPGTPHYGRRTKAYEVL